LFGGPVGGFTTVNLPGLGPTQAWGNHLSTNGTIRVISTLPTNIVAQLTGNALGLSWPADHTGWRLQAQTNGPAAGLGTNWVDVPAASTTNLMNFPINPLNSSVFYRLRFP
jgi:hypothetical protein